MANQVTFNNHLSFINGDGGVSSGLSYWNVIGDDSYYDFNGTTKIPIDITSDMVLNSNIYKTKTLQHYSNGVKLILTYHVDNTGTRDINISGTAIYQDKDGNTLPNYTFRYNDEIGGTETLYSSIGFTANIENGQMYPIGEAVNNPPIYMPTMTWYGNADIEPYGGQPASDLSYSGCIFDSKMNSNISDRPSMTGIVKVRESDWGYYYSAPRELGNFDNYHGTTQYYDEYFKWLEKHGDGSNLIPDPTEQDPSTGGGGGSTDYQSGTKGPHGDDVGIPSLPSVSAIQTGFITMYNPSASTLRSLAGELWSTDFTDVIAKFMNDPFDALICLNMLPFSPITSGSNRIRIGNYQSEVTAPVVSNQYKNISCGTLRVPENWRNFLDYENTSVQIFLPFVGFRTLDIADVMNQTLSVEYNCDILTGQAVCFVTTDGYCLYQFPCNIASQIPMSGSHMASMLSAISGFATAVVGTGATIASGGAAGVALTGLAVSGASSAVNGMKKSVEHGGALNGCLGQLGGLTPYIALHKPVQSLPSNYRGLKGYPSNIGGSLGSFSGYTEVAYVHLDGVSATDREKEEIERLLKEGVIV